MGAALSPDRLSGGTGVGVSLALRYADMRLLLMVVMAALAVLYFTVGLRFGYVTLTETHLFNASGTNTYVFRTLEDRQQVGVVA